MGHTPVVSLFFFHPSTKTEREKGKRGSFHVGNAEKKGPPENVCYVIIILLHHYPFLFFAINAISGAEMEKKKTHLNFYLATFGMRKTERIF